MARQPTSEVVPSAGIRTARRIGLGVVIGLASVGADLLTKMWAAESFADGRVTVIPKVLWFTYTENTGVAFSMLRGVGEWVGIAAVVAVVVVLAALRHERPTSEVVGFGLVMGGALGNLIDRIARGPGVMDGPVIDWIQVPSFPVFNLADSALTVGVGLLLLSAWFHRADT